MFARARTGRARAGECHAHALAERDPEKLWRGVAIIAIVTLLLL
jgi:hypothetical protein